MKTSRYCKRAMNEQKLINFSICSPFIFVTCHIIKHQLLLDKLGSCFIVQIGHIYITFEIGNSHIALLEHQRFDVVRTQLYCVGCLFNLGEDFDHFQILIFDSENVLVDFLGF